MQPGIGVPTHAPPEQTSPQVHGCPSLHKLVLLTFLQPLEGSHESLVHTLLSSQLIGVPPQTPPEHTSLDVQAFPSPHVTLLAVWVQPWVGLQASVVQTLPSSQFGGAPPRQEPPEHVSAVVQAFPSSQALVLFTFLHPVAGLQESSVQPLPSWQLGGGPPTHTPPEQTSPVVHAFPSLQGLVLLVNTQTPPWHECVVQTFPSLHWLLWLHSMQPGMGVPTHVPPEQTSPLVHACPSLQELVLLAC
jgi:hypothetical protein